MSASTLAHPEQSVDSTEPANHPTSQTVYFAIDLATTNLSASVCIDENAVHPVRCPDNGEDTPAVLFIDENGAAIVGGKALQMALKAPEQLFTHDKRRMETAPHEPIRAGGPTPVQCAAEKLRHMADVARQTVPELDAAFQSGDVYVVVTVPANSSSLHKQAVMEAGSLAGLEIKQLFPEPVAAMQSFLSDCGRSVLLDGHTTLVCDLGGGTYDLTICSFRDGKFHEVAVTGNSDIGGLTFTGALFEAICDRYGHPDLKCYYNPLTGFDSLAEDKDTASLRLPLKLWNCAESIKCSLAVNDTATEFVEFPGGAIESIAFTREEFLSLAQDGYRRICETTANAVAEHGPVDHILLVGGSSLLFGLRNELAASLSIAADEIHLRADSRTLIANGACQMAMSGVVDETDQVVSRGIAVRVDVRREGQPHESAYRLLVAPGQVLPSDGIIIENSNQFLDSQNGHVRLELVFAETKENVCVSDAESAQVLLGPDAVTDIQCITRDLELPAGSYELAIELHCTHGDTKWALRILDRPDLEVLHGSILRHKEHDRVDTQTHAEFDVVVVADSSGSMKPIMAEAASAMESFIVSCPDNVRFSLVGFGSDAEVHAKLGTNPKEMVVKIHELTPSGGTNMGKALELSRQQLAESPRERIVVVYTDGLPNSKKSTRKAADLLRDDGIRIIAISIGNQSDDEFLMNNVAGKSDDFYPCGDIAGLAEIFQQIATSIYVR